MWHVVWRFAAPIAVARACAPRIATRRRLGPVGILVIPALWIPAALLIHNDAAAGSTTTAAQPTGAAVAAAALGRGCLPLRPRRHSQFD